MHGFRLDEVGVAQLSRRWTRGGFPQSFLARSEVASDEWREQFIRTFLERDIPQFGLRIPAHALKGTERGRWSITVNGNWRLTFEFRDGHAHIVDYEDYH